MTVGEECSFTVLFHCRSEQLKRLHSEEVFDVLVIGGGVTGCGIALDSALRGRYIHVYIHV